MMLCWVLIFLTIATKENIDGFLVGGASLQPDFLAIVAAKQ